VKLTRERKVFLGLLGAGVAALIADRLLFAPAGAGAAVPAAEPASAPPPSSRAAPAVEPATPNGVPFSQRVAEAAAGAQSERDPFRVDDSWPKPIIKEEGSAPTAQDLDTFIKQIKLTAVVTQKDHEAQFAMINGRVRKIGDQIGGFRIVAMDPAGVEFESPIGERKRVALDLPSPLPTVKPEPAR